MSSYSDISGLAADTWADVLGADIEDEEEYTEESEYTDEELEQIAQELGYQDGYNSVSQDQNTAWPTPSNYSQSTQDTSWSNPNPQSFSNWESDFSRIHGRSADGYDKFVADEMIKRMKPGQLPTREDWELLTIDLQKRGIMGPGKAEFVPFSGNKPTPIPTGSPGQGMSKEDRWGNYGYWDAQSRKATTKEEYESAQNNMRASITADSPMIPAIPDYELNIDSEEFRKLQATDPNKAGIIYAAKYAAMQKAIAKAAGITTADLRAAMSYIGIAAPSPYTGLPIVDYPDNPLTKDIRSIAEYTKMIQDIARAFGIPYSSLASQLSASGLKPPTTQINDKNYIVNRIAGGGLGGGSGGVEGDDDASIVAKAASGPPPPAPTVLGGLIPDPNIPIGMGGYADLDAISGLANTPYTPNQPHATSSISPIQDQPSMDDLWANWYTNNPNGTNPPSEADLWDAWYGNNPPQVHTPVPTSKRPVQPQSYNPSMDEWRETLVNLSPEQMEEMLALMPRQVEEPTLTPENFTPEQNGGSLDWMTKDGRIPFLPQFDLNTDINEVGRQLLKPAGDLIGLLGTGVELNDEKVVQKRLGEAAGEGTVSDLLRGVTTPTNYLPGYRPSWFGLGGEDYTIIDAARNATQALGFTPPTEYAKFSEYMQYPDVKQVYKEQGAQAAWQYASEKYVPGGSLGRMGMEAFADPTMLLGIGGFGVAAKAVGNIPKVGKVLSSPLKLLDTIDTAVFQTLPEKGFKLAGKGIDAATGGKLTEISKRGVVNKKSYETTNVLNEAVSLGMVVDDFAGRDPTIGIFPGTREQANAVESAAHKAQEAKVLAIPDSLKRTVGITIRQLVSDYAYQVSREAEQRIIEMKLQQPNKDQLLKQGIEVLSEDEILSIRFRKIGQALDGADKAIDKMLTEVPDSISSPQANQTVSEAVGKIQKTFSDYEAQRKTLFDSLGGWEDPRYKKAADDLYIKRNQIVQDTLKAAASDVVRITGKAIPETDSLATLYKQFSMLRAAQSSIDEFIPLISDQRRPLLEALAPTIKQYIKMAERDRTSVLNAVGKIAQVTGAPLPDMTDSTKVVRWANDLYKANKIAPNEYTQIRNTLQKWVRGHKDLLNSDILSLTGKLLIQDIAKAEGVKPAAHAEKYYDMAMSMWKSIALLSPRYYAQNIGSQWVMGAMEGVNPVTVASAQAQALINLAMFRKAQPARAVRKALKEWEQAELPESVTNFGNAFDYFELLTDKSSQSVFEQFDQRLLYPTLATLGALLGSPAGAEGAMAGATIAVGIPTLTKYGQAITKGLEEAARAAAWHKGKLDYMSKIGLPNLIEESNKVLRPLARASTTTARTARVASRGMVNTGTAVDIGAGAVGGGLAASEEDASMQSIATGATLGAIGLAAGRKALGRQNVKMIGTRYQLPPNRTMQQWIKSTPTPIIPVPKVVDGIPEIAYKAAKDLHTTLTSSFPTPGTSAYDVDRKNVDTLYQQFMNALPEDQKSLTPNEVISIFEERAIGEPALLPDGIATPTVEAPQSALPSGPLPNLTYKQIKNLSPQDARRLPQEQWNIWSEGRKDSSDIFDSMNSAGDNFAPQSPSINESSIPIRDYAPQSNIPSTGERTLPSAFAPSPTPRPGTNIPTTSGNNGGNIPPNSNIPPTGGNGSSSATNAGMPSSSTIPREFTIDTKRIKESGGQSLYINLNDAKSQASAWMSDLGATPDDVIGELKRVGLDTEEGVRAWNEEFITKYVEGPAQNTVRQLLQEGKRPTYSNAYGVGEKGVWWEDSGKVLEPVQDDSLQGLGNQNFTPLRLEDYPPAERAMFRANTGTMPPASTDVPPIGSNGSIPPAGSGGNTSSRQPFTQSQVDSFLQSLRSTNGMLGRQKFLQLMKANGIEDEEAARYLSQVLVNHLAEGDIRGEAKANKIHFNYAVTDNMEAWLKHIFPFIVWNKRAYPFFAQNALEHPGIIMALSRLNNMSKQDTEGKPDRVKGMVSMGRLGRDIAKALGVEGEAFSNPLEAIMPFADFNFDPGDGTIATQGRKMLSSGGFGVAPWWDAMATTGGLYGYKAQPNLLPRSNLFQGATGVDVERDAPAILGWKKYADAAKKLTTGEDSPSDLPQWLLEQEIEQMSMEKEFTPQHPKYMRAKNDPDSEIYKEAEKRARRKYSRSQITNFISPFYTVPVSDTEAKATAAMKNMPVFDLGATGKPIVPGYYGQDKTLPPNSGNTLSYTGDWWDGYKVDTGDRETSLMTNDKESAESYYNYVQTPLTVEPMKKGYNFIAPNRGTFDVYFHGEKVGWTETEQQAEKLYNEKASNMNSENYVTKEGNRYKVVIGGKLIKDTANADEANYTFNMYRSSLRTGEDLAARGQLGNWLMQNPEAATFANPRLPISVNELWSRVVQWKNTKGDYREALLNTIDDDYWAEPYLEWLRSKGKDPDKKGNIGDINDVRKFINETMAREKARR